MEIDIELYRNREQSFIKHQFLTKYLKPAAYKTLLGYSSTFNFVDAFAGPWKVSDDAKYSDASFEQAISTLEEVKADLQSKGMEAITMRFCLCERRPEAVELLREYAKERTAVEIYVFEGDFEDNLERIAEKIPNGFTFSFIDPTGWDLRNEKIFQFLRDRTKSGRGEFLLNFMAEHINRHAEYDKVEDSFGRFLAFPDWTVEFGELRKSLSSEEAILRLLKVKMRETGVAKYVPDLSIMIPRVEKVKMRLILGTHSPKGLALFRDIQEKVERQEIEMRGKIKEGDSLQVSMFSALEIAEILQKSKGVGCKRYQLLAEEQVKSLLTGRPFVKFGTIAIHVMDALPMRLTHINKLLVDLKKRGIVTFVLPGRETVPKDETRISLSS
jgi:three-Cys-motif partner protein